MDHQKLLTLSGELGYHLLMCGAEIYRVETSISYLLKAYGVTNGEVFALPTCVFISLTTPDHHALSCMRRVRGPKLDIYKLEALNDLCRRLCREKLDLEVARLELKEVAIPRPLFTPLQKLMAYMLSTWSFGLLFGGDAMDAVASGLCGLAVGLCLQTMERLGTNLFFKTIVGSFVIGVVAVLCVSVGLASHVDLIIIGAMMALAPGLVMTNFMRDIMVGDMLSGLIRLADTLLTGAGMVLGSGLALSLARLFGGVL